MKTWTYGLLLRPVTCGGAPSGWLSYEEKTDYVFRWGTVTYDHPLTDEEVDKYELINDNPEHVQNVIQVTIQRAKEELEGANLKDLPSGDLAEIVLGMLHSNRWSGKIHPRHAAKITNSVMEALLL